MDEETKTKTTHSAYKFGKNPNPGRQQTQTEPNDSWCQVYIQWV